MKTNKLLPFLAFIFLIFNANIVSAQVSLSPVFSTLRLEARADFESNWWDVDNTNDPNSITYQNAFGFRGRYFNLHVAGNLNDQFSYYFRQRIVAKSGSVNFFDNTDFLYLNYAPNKNWGFRIGKDALSVGGYEYDAPPIDVLFCTNYWDYFYCFQIGASVAYRSDDGTQMIMAQVANSPYLHYGCNTTLGLGQEWQSSMLSYNLLWSGNFNHFRTLYSVNMYEREPGKFMNYIALGNKLVYDKWDLYVDFLHHSLAPNDWGDNYAVVSRLNVHLTPELNLFVKGAYEQNRSDYDALDLRSSANPDCLIESQHEYVLYGGGFEYRPHICPSVRLHGFVACRRTTDYNPTVPVVDNSMNVNLGVTWNMDIHKMLTDRITK